MKRPQLDHVSIGVDDGEASLKLLREHLGATPLSGERLPTFRYVLTRVGDANRGMQVELIEPQGAPDTFMRRFLARHGEGAHHLTFTVPDVERTIRDVERAGYRVVQIDLEHPPWREAFIFPTEPGIGVVIQIADSDRGYPPMSEFLETRVADPESIPHNRGGRDRYWWRQVRETVQPQRTVTLERIDFTSDAHERTLALLTGPLGGVAKHVNADRTDISWGDAVLSLSHGEGSGVRSLVCDGLAAERFEIGRAVFRPEGGTP